MSCGCHSNPVLPTATLDDVAAQIRDEFAHQSSGNAAEEQPVAPPLPPKKKISQETFDEVVKENMEEFDMSEEEALADAVEQFGQQGVDVSNLITTLEAKEAHLAIEKLVNALNDELKELESSGQAIEVSSLSMKLDDLARACAKSDNERVSAGKHGTVGAAAYLCKKFVGNKEIVLKSLELLGELMKVFDNREIIPLQAFEAITKCMIEYSECPRIQAAGFGAISSSIGKHEENKRNFKDAGVNAIAVQTLLRHSEEKDPILGVCKFIRIYLSDDDRRPGVHPGTFPRARELGEDYENGVLRPLVSLLQKEIVIADESLTKSVLGTIKSVAVNDVICKHVATKGGLDAVLLAFEAHITNEPVAAHSCMVLKAVTRNDDIKHIVGKGNGLGLLIRALEEHASSERVSEQALQCLSVLCLRQPSNCETIADLGCLQLIVSAMTNHPNSPQIQRPAISTLRNMVSSWQNKDLQTRILDEGAEPLIRKARANHPLCEEVAFAALRDLGCQYHE